MVAAGAADNPLAVSSALDQLVTELHGLQRVAAVEFHNNAPWAHAVRNQSVLHHLGFRGSVIAHRARWHDDRSGMSLCPGHCTSNATAQGSAGSPVRTHCRTEDEHIISLTSSFGVSRSHDSVQLWRTDFVPLLPRRTQRVSKAGWRTPTHLPQKHQSGLAPSASFSSTFPVRASTPTSKVLPFALMSNE